MMQFVSFLNGTILVYFEWIALSVVLAYGVDRSILKIAQKYLSSRSWFPSHLELEKHFKGIIFWVLFFLTLKVSLPWVMAESALKRTSDQWIGIFFVLALTGLIRKALDTVRMTVDARLMLDTHFGQKERKLKTQVQFIERVILIFVYVVSASIILMGFEGAREIGSSLIASAGLAGITLGLAAQKSLANLMAGFQIAFTQPIRMGDIVSVEGEWGKVEEITLTYVIVRLWDRRTLIVPIHYFLEKPFQNWTRSSGDLVGSIFLYLDYQVELSQLRGEFERFLKTTSLWDGEVQKVQLTQMSEKSIEVRLAMSAASVADAFDLRCLVREHMIQWLKKTNPQCFPQARVSPLGHESLGVGIRPAVHSDLRFPNDVGFA